MGKQYKQLTLEERYNISFLYKEGKSLREIASAMARSPSTISRELKRNMTKTKGYAPSYAQEQTAGRRWRGSKLERQPELRDAVLNRLAMGWSRSKPPTGWRKIKDAMLFLMSQSTVLSTLK